ncbi:hypothetical protein ACFQ21_28620, partial [Ohtaekwangia kribbensis]
MTSSSKKLSVLARLFFFCFVLAGTSSRAQLVTIPIETHSNALVLQADEKKNFNILYFGEKLQNSSEYI